MITIPVFDGNRPARFHQLLAAVPLPASADDQVLCFAGEKLCFEGDPANNENSNVLLHKLAPTGIYPIIESRLPKLREPGIWLNCVINLLNEDYQGTKGILKLDLGSTSEKSRHLRYGDVVSLTELSKLFTHFPKLKNNGKIILVFSPSMPLDGSKLQKLFEPTSFAIELRRNNEGLAFPYRELEQDLVRRGYSLAYEEDSD